MPSEHIINLYILHVAMMISLSTPSPYRPYPIVDFWMIYYTAGETNGIGHTKYPALSESCLKFHWDDLLISEGYD